MSHQLARLNLCKTFVKAVHAQDFSADSAKLWEAILRNCAHFVGARQATLTLHSKQGIQDFRSHPTIPSDRIGSVNDSLTIMACISGGRISHDRGVLCFQFENGRYHRNVDAQRRVNLLLLQLQEMLEVQLAQDLLVSGIERIFDRSEVGICVVNSNRIPIAINPAAKAAIARCSLLSINSTQQLCCDCMTKNRMLERAVDDACKLRQAAFKTRRLVVAQDSSPDTTSILLEINRLQPSINSTTTLAMITFIVPTTDLGVAVERLSLMFGLTQAESEVLSNLATGATNEQIAARRHVSSETIRSQVSSLLGKLEISRRNELIPLLAASSFNVLMD